LEDEFPFGMTNFQGQAVSFGECNHGCGLLQIIFLVFSWVMAVGEPAVYLPGGMDWLVCQQ